MRMSVVAACLFMLTGSCSANTNDPYAPLIPSSPPSVAPSPLTEVSKSSNKKDQYYANCTEAKNAGAAPLRQGVDDGYRAALDRDRDGIACDG